MLWRLKLRGVDSGARWQRLAERWEQVPLADARPFFRAHAMMAFAATGRKEAARRLLKSLPLAGSEVAGRWPEHAVSRPVCEALLAFAAEDYAACLASLYRVSHIADRCGGSLAQCQISQLTFVEAKRRAGETLLAA